MKNLIVKYIKYTFTTVLILMLALLATLLVGCCDCPEPDFTGWKKVDNEFYKDESTDSIWVKMDWEDNWVGKWNGKTFFLHKVGDTIFYKEKK
jgi:hypothetical protein